MYDIYLEWGQDLTAGSSGDLALADGVTRTNQRVLRRLLTSAGDYIWNLQYGGSLSAFVGSTTNPADIEAVIRTQISLESAIPTTPTPDVTVRPINATGGYVTADITYADAYSGNVIRLGVSVR